MRQASTVTTVTDALNRMLIQPFCQRTSVRSITDVCVTVAPEKVDNTREYLWLLRHGPTLNGSLTVCKDYLTTQSNGKLIASYYEGSERWCSFAIYTKGTKIHVRCQMGDPKFSIGSDWLDVSLQRIFSTEKWPRISYFRFIRWIAALAKHCKSSTQRSVQQSRETSTAAPPSSSVERPTLTALGTLFKL